MRVCDVCVCDVCMCVCGCVCDPYFANADESPGRNDASIRPAPIALTNALAAMTACNLDSSNIN